jgi:hypothetical protein
VLRVLARRQAGREPEPSAAVIDSPSAKTTGVGGPARGYDGAKRLNGRKRHIFVRRARPRARRVRARRRRAGPRGGAAPRRERRRGRPATPRPRVGRPGVHGRAGGLAARDARVARGGRAAPRAPALAVRARRAARARSGCCRGGGWWSARSPGWASLARCRRTTSGSRQRARR